MESLKRKSLFIDSSSDEEVSKRRTPNIKITCSTCLKEKAMNQFPKHAELRHDRERETCRPCFQDWIKIRLSIEFWDQLRCPQCAVLLSQRVIKHIATRKTYLELVETGAICRKTYADVLSQIRESNDSRYVVFNARL